MPNQCICKKSIDTVKTQVFRSAIYGITTMFRQIYVLAYLSFSIIMALPFPFCETPLSQRPTVANSFYNPLAVHVHPPVPSSDVLHKDMRSVVTYMRQNIVVTPI